MRRTTSLALLSFAACADITSDVGSDVAPDFGKGNNPNVPLGVTISDAGTRIRSDGLGEYVNGVGGVAAYIDGVGNLHFNPGGGARTLVLDYSVQVSGTPFTPAPPTGPVQMLTQMNGAAQPEPPLPTLTVGQSACYPVSFAYLTATTKTWGPFFHSTSDNTPTTPTTYGNVTRTSSTTWTVTSSGACPGTPDLGGVHYTPNTTLKPRDQVTLDGNFSMPFSVVLRIL